MLLELFGSFAGQLSLAVILFMLGMIVFFVRLFIKKVLVGKQANPRHVPLVRLITPYRRCK